MMTWLFVFTNLATAVLTGASCYVWGRSIGIGLKRNLMAELQHDDANPTTPKTSRHWSSESIRWVVTGLFFVGLGALGIVNDIQVSNVQQCQSGYLSGAATLATARDEAIQTLLNDVSNQAGSAQFFKDLKAEQGAYQALAKFRASHVPKEACP